MLLSFLLMFAHVSVCCWSLDTSSAADDSSSPSSPSSSSSAALIKIVGIPGGQTQSLPTPYVETFDRWIIPGDDDHGNQKTSLQKVDRKDVVTGTTLTLTFVPGLRIRPSLDIMIKNGIPSYVMGGVQVSLMMKVGNDVATTSHGDDDDEQQQQQQEFVLLAMPLAKQWTTIQFAAELSFRIECFTSSSREGTRSEDTTTSSSSVKRLDLSTMRDGTDSSTPQQQMQSALERFGIVSSELEESSPLLKGFHILSVPLPYSKWTELPESSSPASLYDLICLATAEPDPEELLKDPNLLEMTASSLLEFKVKARTTSGSEAKSEL